MKKIRNYEVLLSNGVVSSRQIVLEIADRTLDRLDSYQRIRSIMRMEGSVLHIGTRSWDLSRKRNVYLIGAGKACNHMAMAVDHVLGDHLTHGIAIVKIREESDRFNKTEVFVGGHPLLIARPWNAHAAGVNLLGVGYMIAGSLSVGCSFVYRRIRASLLPGSVGR
ncbi:Permease of the drug/metabolite transporter (DMT) superfamily [Burkholderia sp. AU4i]|uniref:DUF4147 domain-containing protein n=1 Tax=Burkholderia sp. AU4i TaxID=1335308 RepID=UPI0003988499|nr:Permease of the drug/metabolite transporter (DMT) superfamily [Burkholderia sp. AU4i]